MWKECIYSCFPTPYYLPHSDKRFRNGIENTIHIFGMKKKWFSKLLLNRLHFAKNLTWVMMLVSIAFQRYIASPIWAMFAEDSPKVGFLQREVQVCVTQEVQPVIRIIF